MWPPERRAERQVPVRPRGADPHSRLVSSGERQDQLELKPLRSIDRRQVDDRDEPAPVRVGPRRIAVIESPVDVVPRQAEALHGLPGVANLDRKLLRPLSRVVAVAAEHEGGAPPDCDPLRRADLECGDGAFGLGGHV